MAVITPDDKDWTWAAHEACPECGFDGGACDPSVVPEVIRANADRWRELHAEGRIVPGRPDDATWSALEYACHVRDVHLRYDARFHLMLDQDDPLSPNWDQDASAVDDRYDEQDPATVVAELSAAAEQVAATLEAVVGEQWQRPGRRSDGASFTVDTMSRYFAHDPVHHIWDVTRAR